VTPPSPTRYAKVGEDHVAYQTIGHGRRDVVLIPSWFSNVEAIWDLPPAAHLLERLASFCRLIVFDRRGTGLSDPAPVADAPLFEQFADDLVAVLDAVGSERAALIGCDGGGPVAMVAAAMFPGRVSALVLVNTFARLARDDDYPEGLPPGVLDTWLRAISTQWAGDPGFVVNAPSVVGDEEMGALFTRLLRMSASPRVATTTRRVLYAADVRQVLSSIQAPTLVVHRRDDRMIPAAQGRYLARHIPGARMVELPGEDHLFYFGDADAIAVEVEEFLTGIRRVEVNRVLATVLFTDIVRSTEMAARVGDRRWRQLLDDHYRMGARVLARHRGELVKTTGDGVLATFDGPARAVHCAAGIREAVRALGLEIRAGLHTGEVERRGDDITGLAVVIARRICDGAGSGSVVVSRTVTDLVVGSGLVFEPGGSATLKGVPGEWQLFHLLSGWA
jgi:pimeloyl-ACP methyl ester carboxylesterase